MSAPASVPSQQLIDAFVEAAGDDDLASMMLFADNWPAHVNERDSTGKTALTWAATNDKIETMFWLIDTLGVDVNAADREGWTALHFFAYRGAAENVDGLLTRNADTDAVTNAGNTPAEMADQMNHAAIAARIRGHKPAAISQPKITALAKLPRKSPFGGKGPRA